MIRRTHKPTEKLPAYFRNIDLARIDMLIKNYILDEEFMTQHADRLNWWAASRYQTLSEEFMDTHLFKLDWTQVCAYQRLSMQFMTTHAAWLDWDTVSRHQDLSEKFIIANLDRLNLVVICRSYPELVREYHLDLLRDLTYN